MIPLPLNLKKNGFDYVQVLRGKKGCIYAQRYSGNLIAYEVCLIRTKPATVIKGKFIDVREKFPGNEDFGHYAWSCKTWKEAKRRYDELENKSVNNN